MLLPMATPIVVSLLAQVHKNNISKGLCISDFIQLPSRESGWKLFEYSVFDGFSVCTTLA